MSKGADQPRVAVVTGPVFSGNSILWQSCRATGVDLVLIGADRYPGSPWQWDIGPVPGVPTHLLKPVPLRKAGYLWWTYRGLGHVLREVDPDILHVTCEPWGLPLIQTLISKRRSSKNARACAHGADNIYSHGGTLERSTRKLVLRWTLRQLDGFVGWNPASVERARESGLDVRVPTTVIPAVVPDPAVFDPAIVSKSEARRKWDIPNDTIVIGFAGRLTAEKGAEDLVSLLERFSDQKAFFAIWGGGTFEGNVRRALDQGQHGRFFGSAGIDEMPQALAACDVVVVPSRDTGEVSEQFSRVVVEAQLMGAAVVAYDVGALSDVVGQHGAIVPEGDVDALVETLARLVNDDAARERLQAGAREAALARFDPHVLAQRLGDFWSTVARDERATRARR